MRHKMVAGLFSAGTLMIGLAAFTPVAHAAGTVTEPSDCSLSSTTSFGATTYHMTCTARPAGQQWQIAIYCDPRGPNGADWNTYGAVVTGNGTSSSNCDIISGQGYADISFSDSGLQPPGRQN